MNRWFARRPLAALAVLLALLVPGWTADPIYPLGSRLGMTPPAGMALSKTFPGFEDQANNVFIRLIALPDRAYAEIKKTMTNDALKKQGMTVEKRDYLTLTSGKGLLIVAQQQADQLRFRKWLLVAPIGELTAMISFEIPNDAKAAYSEAVIRAALASVTTRPTVPPDEQLALLPFKIGELSGFRIVGVVPGRAIQLTDGPHDVIEQIDQPHMVVAAQPGGPPQPSDRSNFARNMMSGLPNLRDLHITGSEAIRLGGQQGHEIRAEAKDIKTGADIEIVQWLRFGNGAYIRMVGFAPRESWLQAFPRFRAVRDGLEPR